MSDSENDLLPSNVFTFQNENTMISAKGPSVNGNITNLSFRNNLLTSTMHMPRNFERQRYGEPSFDQRSMYYRRETSPASMYSGSDMRARNFHQSYYGGGMGSQRSMYYGRSGSPMSMRSMDSNASVSAADIALAFKNVNFNKHDLRMIKEAYNKFMKRRIRKKIEKRRNMRLFLKGYRHKSGYDSGEQGSDSSISSDECKSTSSALYKDNMSCRSTRTDLSDFRRAIRDSTMYKDCTNNLKQNVFKNKFSIPTATSISGSTFDARNVCLNRTALPQTEFSVPNAIQKQPISQKERFKTGYLLPSQRFNKSFASMPILERDPRLQARQKEWNARRQVEDQVLKTNGHVNGETDSDQEAIFSEVTVREKSMFNIESAHDKITEQSKRGLETDDNNRGSDRKRPKLSSPVKKPNQVNAISKNKTTPVSKDNKKTNEKNKSDENNKNEKNVDNASNKQSEEFEFLKPQFPVRKSGPAKPKEKLISKSAQPLIDEIIAPSIPQTEEAPIPKTITQKNLNEEQPDTTQQSNNSDLSVRPSFIKRKLFTQKTDVQESKNLSNDNLNSPQTNVYSAIHKEKHKARKLVTNQSCLSRDIAQEGNNLLDLIHKIVPPDQMNGTNVTNKTSISTSASSKNPINDDDRWDITSVISTCNNDNCSETYTDEEIFGADTTKKKNSTASKNIDIVNKPKENNMKTNNINKSIDNNKKAAVNNIITKSECRILIEKLPQSKIVSKPTLEVNKLNVPSQENDYNKKSIYNCVKSFWDTDFESDIESPAPKRATYRCEEVKENQNKTVPVEENKVPKNKKTLNISLASVSESIKSKTMPTNNLGILKKLNISKTLSIKSLLTPKQVKSKPKIVKRNEEKEVPKLDEIPTHVNTESEKKSIKQKNTIVIDFDNGITLSGVKKIASKKTKNNGDLLNTTKKQTNSKTNSKVNIEAKKTETKKPANNNGEILNTTTAKPTQAQSKTKPKTAKSGTDIAKTVANKSISGRTVRTPKRKACCDEPIDQDKSAKSSETKSSGSKPKQKTNNKKAKLVESNSAKGKAAKNVDDGRTQSSITKQVAPKVNESVAKRPRTKVVKNNKTEPKIPTEISILEVPEMSRTLRSRRIDLSSSINSSTENVTLQIRSLRTRRVDLSNSLKNSSLDETITKGRRTNAVSKKVAAQANRTDVLNKKPRR